MIKKFPLLSFAGIFLFLFGLVQIVLNTGIAALQPHILQAVAGKSIQIDKLEWKLAYWNGWNRVSVVGIRSEGLLLIEHDFSAPREFVSHIHRMDFKLLSLNKKHYGLTLSQMDFVGGRFLDEMFPENHYFERLDDAYLSFSGTLESFEPQAVLESMKQRVRGVLDWLLHEGEFKEVAFSGELTLLVNDFPAPLRFSTADERDGSKKLMASQEDLRVIAERLEKKFTDEDVEIISHHVLRASRLIRFRDRALKIADEIYQNNPEMSRESARHIMWSYYLARDYGNEFAKRVTDAHEIGDDLASDEDRYMDLKNNERGRYYAEQKFSEGAVKEMMLRDPHVIKNISEVKIATI